MSIRDAIGRAAGRIRYSPSIRRIAEATTPQIRRSLTPWSGLCSFVADGNMVLGWIGIAMAFSSSPSRSYGIQSVLDAAALTRRLLLGQTLPESLRVQGLNAAALSPLRLR
jgi:D-arginine dehydrogenase